MKVVARYIVLAAVAFLAGHGLKVTLTPDQLDFAIQVLLLLITLGATLGWSFIEKLAAKYSVTIPGLFSHLGDLLSTKVANEKQQTQLLAQTVIPATIAELKSQVDNIATSPIAVSSNLVQVAPIVK